MTKPVGPATVGVNRLAPSDSVVGTKSVSRGVLAGISAVSAALLMTELALTRIFSVTMYYHLSLIHI